MKNEDLVLQVTDIVNSSKRQKPAYFTNDGQKYKTFLVDFDIDPEDEYKMTCESWSKGSETADKLVKQHCNPDCTYGDIIITLGEDVMLGGYILTKLGGSDKLENLKNKMIESEKESYLKDENLDLMVAGGIAKFIDFGSDFYNYCVKYGGGLAAGKTPV